jgi:hypothetical protein
MTARRVLVAACLVAVLVELVRPSLVAASFDQLDRPSVLGMASAGATFLTAALALVAALAVERDDRALRGACVLAGVVVALVGLTAATVNPPAAYTTGFPDLYFVFAGLGPAVAGGLAAWLAGPARG